MVILQFLAGTLELRGLPEEGLRAVTSMRWDTRSLCFRAPASAYAEIVRTLVRNKIDFEDHARAYQEFQEEIHIHREPRPYQTESLEAWRRHRGRGVIVLPTGAGKTHVAVLAIHEKKRSTLVVAPTLDLVRQWYDLLRTTFSTAVGIIGGGEHSIHPLTVTTYDSAYIHMEHIGSRFGLIIFDECHHLPSSTYALAAQFCIAPYRLGLTATPERSDGRESTFQELIGPIVYRKDILELSGDYLAEYDVERIVVELSPEERNEYESERALYKDFLLNNGIRISDPKGWGDFIRKSSRTTIGRRAMQAYRRQRELAFTAPAKLDYVAHLLHVHRLDRALLFTQDNATVYEISRKFLIPAITHQTKIRERSEILSRLAAGTYNAVITSKVLNEGVDVPDANVAIVLSGSGSVREHVQRLGRILRKKQGKIAILYELITARTGETFTSDRRRDHQAYQSS